MNEYVNQALVMIQKMVATLTPIAAKAYEIALLTLQVDAINSLVLVTVGALFGVVLLRIMWKLHTWAQLRQRKDQQHPALYIFVLLPLGAGGVALIITNTMQLINVWLWVKLFQPELWLAHMAIEKLIK